MTLKQTLTILDVLDQHLNKLYGSMSYLQTLGVTTNE